MSRTMVTLYCKEETNEGKYIMKKKIGNLEFRVGTFKEDIFSTDEDSYEFDVIFYYLRDANVYPISYYYDNIDVKYNNTFETIAQHIASGNAESSLLNLIDDMENSSYIYLCGITEPICNKKQLIDRVDEIVKDQEAEHKKI